MSTAETSEGGVRLTDTPRRVGRVLPNNVVSESSVSRLVDERKVCVHDDSIEENCTECERIELYWNKVTDIKDSNGGLKYPVLKKTVRAVLSLSHGNADVERGFSSNNLTIITQRTKMGSETVNGIRSIIDHFRARGIQPYEMQFTPRLLACARSASSAYRMRIEEEKRKDEERRKGEKRGREEEMAIEAEDKARKERELKAREERYRKLGELQKKEVNLQEQMSAANILLSDGNNRLRDAMKKKGDIAMLEAARNMIQLATEKLNSASRELEKIRSGRAKLEQETGPHKRQKTA